MGENQLSLWTNSKAIYVKGDTFRHSGDLWRFGFRWDHQRGRWNAPPNVTSNMIQSMNSKPKRGLQFVITKKKSWVSGDTTPFRQTFASWGGTCKDGSQTWHFIGEPGRSRLKDFQAKVDEANKLGEAVVIEALEKYEQFQRYIANNAIEVATVVHQLFDRAESNFWWPATLDNPRCRHCDFHLVWYWYHINEKDIEKTLNKRMPFVCPGCKHDYSR
jgi:hypothetical protein